MTLPILSSVLSPVSSLSSVSLRESRLIEKLCGPSVLDVCWHVPSQIEWREWCEASLHGSVSTKSTLIVKVCYHVPKAGRRPYQVFCVHGEETIALTFFNAQSSYLQKILPPGAQRLISGSLEKKRGEWQMVHPDHIGLPEEKGSWVGERTLYPLTQGLTQKMVRKAIEESLGRLPVLPEWIPQMLLQEKQWPSWKDAILTLHHTSQGKEQYSLALERLAFDEILSHQLMLRLTRKEQDRAPGFILDSPGLYRQKLQALLPFSLTQGQEQTVQEILKDTQTGHRMVRLLQGDVGSGKTVVAFIAMLSAIESGHQAAYLSPTEILTQQHYKVMKEWGNALGIPVEIFTSAMTQKNRKLALEKLRLGHISVAIGTHSLLEDDVEFQSLGFVVIDEQHRFGVDQRSRLLAKGPQSHTLIMTATPIPRTLALTLYGDIAISTLREKPANRSPITTRVLPLSRIKEVYQGLQRILAKGQQIYWVCPLIEENEEGLGHVEKRFDHLTHVFGHKVGLLHGRLKSQEKEQIMAAFSKGDLQILVATTVIEVGVDVPSATVMIVENAELFGLFQLHQLRGRVGRSDLPSSCLFLYHPPLSPTAQRRLEILRESNDGFKIAEADLKLRGGGDFFGTKQSGLPDFRFFRFDDHAPLISLATSVIRSSFVDKKIEDPFKILLSLFNHEQAKNYARIG